MGDAAGADRQRRRSYPSPHPPNWCDEKWARARRAARNAALETRADGVGGARWSRPPHPRRSASRSPRATAASSCWRRSRGCARCPSGRRWSSSTTPPAMARPRRSARSATTASHSCGARRAAALPPAPTASRCCSTPYVAFADDDSWCEPGALAAAARRFDADPRLGLLAARILVGARPARRPRQRAAARPSRARLPRLRRDRAAGGVPRRRRLPPALRDRRRGAAARARPRRRGLAARLRARGRRPPLPAARRRRPRPPPRDDAPQRPLDRLAAPPRTAPAGRDRRRAPQRRPPPRLDLARRGARARGLPWIARERRPLPPSVERDLRQVEA